MNAIHPTSQDALDKARQALQAAGQSTRDLGRQRIDQALRWIYRWGWSSPMVIDALTGAQRRGLAAKLVRVGLAIETRTASGAIIEDIPSKIITLTDQGVSLVDKQLAESDLLDYQINPYKINQALLRHDLLAQRATLKKMRDGILHDFQTPKELAVKSTAGEKQPDVLWIRKNSRDRIAVEVELTAKFQRKLNDFVWGIVTGLSTVNDRPPLFDRCLIATDSPAILKRYQDAFKPGASVHRWKKDTQSRWKIDHTVRVPAYVYERMMWELIK
ncbi:MAG TPA: hypothetical protein PKE37_16845 [Thiomonas arsenitoxydans]|uniref:hypothetical protein n=1 Tax=Thiomonas arsenitoxydans (strain DSM 22701 / CIP 110005 / 3As) TaxID=426114 RepID=UPI002C5168B0|nr:hypothetical protein [Thiomonas arsenitoxydans]HML83420.1 hypothetical protein [Thiomonas arsenitoxydans]